MKMCDPCYFAKFTMKESMADESKGVNHPPTPSGMDYIKASSFMNKQLNETVKTTTLSPEAKPFEPSKPSFIVVSSYKNPSGSCNIPVFPTKRTCCLPLSTLHQYFPLATGLHYNNIQQQLVTVATVGNYSIVQGRIEISQKMFCIPFLGSNFQYFVTESEDFVENKSYSEALVNGTAEELVRNIRVKMTRTVTDIEILEKEIAQMQQRKSWENRLVDEIIRKKNVANETPIDEVTDKVDVENSNIDENRNIPNLSVEQSQVKGEILSSGEGPSKSTIGIGIRSSVRVNRILDSFLRRGKLRDTFAGVKTIPKNDLIDDYGFSDSDEDAVVRVDSIVEEAKNDKTSGKPGPDQPKLDNTCISVSTRPRCVRRVIRK